MKSLKEIEEYAASHFVPIARKDFIVYLKELIHENNYHDVLEIGSAIGYTAINLAMMEDVFVTTIEYNTDRFNMCDENIKDFNLTHKINYIHDDALNVFLSLKFDVIFIDAAKAKNILFFEKFEMNLKDSGVIIIDNIELNDFKKNVSPKKAKFYENKINELKEFLASKKEYDVKYLPVGDGIALIRKIKE